MEISHFSRCVSVATLLRLAGYLETDAVHASNPIKAAKVWSVASLLAASLSTSDQSGRRSCLEPNPTKLG